MKKSMTKWLIPCAAALFTLGASMTSFAASGWSMEGNEWVYLDSDGSRVTDAWKKSGNNWFYLGDDGYMVKSSLVESDDNYYYVNSVGAMVSNEWRAIPSDYEEEDSPDVYWYYFQNNGKAYKAPGSGKTSFKSITKANGEVKKYAFDEQARMLFGWVSDSSERLSGDDAWREGVYYCGSSDDGAQVNNAWAYLEAEDDEADDDYYGSHYFFFSNNGKKVKDTTKTINGYKYRFDEDGAMEYEWYTRASSPVASESDLYYNLQTQGWMAKGWFKTVPGPEVDSEAYENGDEYWFYAKSNGELVTSQIKTINKYPYAFNEKGEMLHGLYKMTFDADRNIETYEKIETASDLPDANEAVEVYYFGNTPKEGVMATKKTTIEIDGEKYTYNFRKSGSNRGAGYNTIYEDCIYIQGRMLKADRDAKYEVVEYNGEDYLITTSGKIAKNKTNVKNGDDKYFCTDSKGIVTYEGYDKYEKQK